MPKVIQGDITLAVGENSYQGIWRATKEAITYYFPFPLPPPYSSGEVRQPLTVKWNKMLPYEIGGQMINRILDEKRTPQSAKNLPF